MSDVPVLFVDDEEDIRYSFGAHFEGHFQILLAADGLEALEFLRTRNNIGVVVTDIRMPRLNGLDLIKEAAGLFPNISFIVVSGHGDVGDIITAMKLGARNYLPKPYNFAELEEAIRRESARFRLLRDESSRREKEQIVEQYLTSVHETTYHLPTRMELVSPLAFRLVAMAEAIGVVDENRRANIALAIIEILNNAVEHGNLALSGKEKISLKTAGENTYQAEMKRRTVSGAYDRRRVKVTFSADSEKAEVIIEDEGDGFDHRNLPDPTHPDNIFLPSGRGILLAKTFLDEVSFLEKGNIVRLVKYRGEPAD